MPEPNAFSTAYLETIHKRHWPEYPVTLEAGRWQGPWSIDYRDEKWYLLREGDVESEAILELRETACLLAAVYPIAFHSPTYGMENESDDTMWSLKTAMGDRGYSTIGQVRHGHEELIIPLHVAHGLLTSPSSLAWLLSAAPPEVLAQAGTLIIKRSQDRVD